MIELEKHSSVINDEISINENSDDVSYVKKKVKRKPQRCDRKTIRDTLNSPKFHLFIITLVVLDCFFVAGELIIDYIEIHISKTHPNLHRSDLSLFTANQHDMDEMYENDTRISDNLSLKKNNASLLNFNKHKEWSMLKTLKVLEKICKYSSFTILSIFVVDILVKLVVEPGKFLKVFELFDAIVVFCGFFLNLYLLKSNVVIHSLSGLITVLRYIHVYVYIMYDEI